MESMSSQRASGKFRLSRLGPPCWLAAAAWLGAPAHAQTDAPETAPPQPAPSASVSAQASTAEPEAAAAAATELDSPAAATEPEAPALSDTEASKNFLSSTEQQFGHNSLQTAEAYTGLGDVQRQAGDHEAAAESYLAAVEIYRAIDGPFTGLALAPLTSLGDNYREAGEYPSAVSAYGEARTVSRRVYGLLNERQLPLLDRLSDTLLSMNQQAEAEAQQVEALRLVQRTSPPESPEALAGIYKYAEWLADRFEFQRARDQYATALRTIRDYYGKDDVRQVDALVGIGNTFRNQRIPESQGLNALQDALALLVAQPERDNLAIAKVLRDLADWQVAFNKIDYDGAEYVRSWELLGDVPGGDALRREWFTGPNYVLREPISLRDLSEEPDAPMGHVLATFDLSKDGQTSNVTLLESDPPGLKDEAVLRHIRRSRFRPQMVNGEVVESTGLALRFNFRYQPESVSDANKEG
jgi:Gram-negative bacterial TonB protein C-terminal/Tetratricopeptide repeat